MTRLTSATDLRQQKRAQRRAVPARKSRQAACRMAAHASILARPAEIRHIAVYLPSDGEMDTGPLIQTLWQLGKRVYLPVLQWRQRNLRFALCAPPTRMRQNRYGIGEPVVAASQLRRANQLDLIFLPLVAIDQRGNRLGMGGGFYDRTLAFCGGKRPPIRPRLIGLGYALQVVSRIEPAPWDIPLKGLVTEVGYSPLPLSAFDPDRDLP
ncbi:MAG: 5-formyltetrahydrofolate cyclo-ligase [Gammaproteobacteria bacterium]|nr:5-formyltetrahydrofolate cyclo-ligase [Gammaproteobacteria bacterium]